MEATVNEFTQQTYLRKPSSSVFWDHNDGSYQRKFVPGAIIWQYLHTGEITLKFDINAEIDQGKYTVLFASLYDLTSNVLNIIQTPSKIVLNKNHHYQLFISGHLIQDEKRMDETWIILFSPQKEPSIPAS